MEYYIDPVTFVTQKSGFESRYIKNLLGLLDEGATIPFISRYRKEMTGSMDEVQVGQVREIYEQFKELEKRKKTVLESIEQQEKADSGITETDRALYRFTRTGRYLPTL